MPRNTSKVQKKSPECVPLLARKQCCSAAFLAEHCLQASSGTPVRTRARAAAREAFSLLEVILALAILGGSMAVLGEAVRLAMENARVTRDLTDAQLYCESKMAELQAGLLTADDVIDTPIEPLSDSMLESDSEVTDVVWLYSIQTELIDAEGLVLVSVTVHQDPETVKKPASFTMTRMMLDESLISTDTTTEGTQ